MENNKILNLKDHLILATIAAGAWAFFYILGMPFDYFQKWSLSEQIILSLITFFAALPLITLSAIILLNKNYVKTGIWVAFYGSFLLALLDFITCGIIQGMGVSFFISHWYITLGYFYIWIISPLIGILLEKFKAQLNKKN